MPNNEYTPLQAAAAGYATRRGGSIEMPSNDTVVNLLHDAFIEGALWALKNPVLTRDLRSKVKIENVPTTTGD